MLSQLSIGVNADEDFLLNQGYIWRCFMRRSSNIHSRYAAYPVGSFVPLIGVCDCEAWHPACKFGTPSFLPPSFVLHSNIIPGISHIFANLHGLLMLLRRGCERMVHSRNHNNNSVTPSRTIRCWCFGWDGETVQGIQTHVNNMPTHCQQGTAVFPNP